MIAISLLLFCTLFLFLLIFNAKKPKSCLMRMNIKQINTLEIRIHALIISFNHRKTYSGFWTLMEIHKIDVRWLLTQTRSFVILFINNLSIQQHPWKLRNTRDCLKEITCNFKNSNLLSYRKTLLQKTFWSSDEYNIWDITFLPILLWSSICNSINWNGTRFICRAM